MSFVYAGDPGRYYVSLGVLANPGDKSEVDPGDGRWFPEVDAEAPAPVAAPEPESTPEPEPAAEAAPAGPEPAPPSAAQEKN